MLATDRIPAAGLCGMAGFAVHLGEPEDADHLADPAGVHDVRLENVRVGELDEIAERPAVAELLAGRHRDIQCPADLPKARHVVLRERLLEMGDAKLLQDATLTDRRPDGVAAVGIESEPGIRSDGLAHLARHLEVLRRIDIGMERAPVHAGS